MWAEFYIDDTATTVSAPTTLFQPVYGSTAVVGRSMTNAYLKSDPTNTTSARLVLGKDGKGVYMCRFAASFTADVGNKTYHIAAHKNTSKLGNISIERKIGTAGDIGAVSAGGFVLLENPNDYIDIRVAAESSGAVLTLNHFSLSMNRITSSTEIGTV